MTLTETVLVSFLLSSLNMFLFAGLFSEATTQRNVKNNYLNVPIFKEIYGEVPFS